MNSSISPYFTRIYGALFLAIFTSVFLTFFILDKWNEHDALEDFVADTLFVMNLLENQRKADKVQASVFYNNLNSELYPFDIEWLDSTSIEQSCSDCFYLTKHKGIDVYEFNTGELVSIHAIANTSAQLVIKDKLSKSEGFYHGLHSETFDIEAYSMLILLIVIVVVIGLVLYLPIRKLQKEIDHLNHMSYQIGKGNLKTQVKPLSEPLTLLAKTFNNMALSLSAKVNESQIFAQAVPHELRTPLSRIQLATGILRNKSTSKEQLALIDNIDQYITDIDELCSQVIQFSKLNIQASTEQGEAFSLNHFVTCRVSKLSLNETICVDVNFTEEITVDYNAANLRLIIDNVLKNAVQHAQKSVTLKVCRITTSIEITIEDDGEGIPIEDYDTVFIPYARLDDSRTRKTGGIGLGLAIAKSAVNQLGGEISVTNSSSNGAIFKITLPTS
ncbi:HAMP domain-containing histidine kinase [Pseudoalteromonas sp. SMS1]|uniref:sensor histidine kinase n=1 Tax=Pseudoalteromonas sp. SMS1 TaxID=2908894 RepID=UPI001F2CF8D2|nr:HAMP domain-containing sensor histidine kinase [Pseudoalteromonas sp. SMS1]MCF2859150.1 HAMP domain-containing histidine kinase [Pseudoalteromonas sp. SMS1]